MRFSEHEQRKLDQDFGRQEDARAARGNRIECGPWYVNDYGGFTSLQRETTYFPDWDSPGVKSIQRAGGEETFTALIKAMERMLGTFCTSAKCEGDEEVIRQARIAVARAKGEQL